MLSKLRAGIFPNKDINETLVVASRHMEKWNNDVIFVGAVFFVGSSAIHGVGNSKSIHLSCNQVTDLCFVLFCGALIQ